MENVQTQARAATGPIDHAAKTHSQTMMSKASQVLGKRTQASVRPATITVEHRQVPMMYPSQTKSLKENQIPAKSFQATAKSHTWVGGSQSSAQSIKKVGMEEGDLGWIGRATSPSSLPGMTLWSTISLITPYFFCFFFYFFEVQDNPKGLQVLFLPILSFPSPPHWDGPHSS